jgi:hypothetical protein
VRSDRPQQAHEVTVTSKNEPTLVLVFVVNGRDVVLDDVNPSWPLHAARNKAIAKSNSTGRPPDEWEIRDEGDRVLDPDRKISTYDFTSGTKLFLNVRVGGGGNV